jgi:DNA-binding transcriptional regulator YiaG
MKTRKSTAGSGARRSQGKADRGARDRPAAGTRILAAIEEATDLLRSEGLESQRLTVRTYRLPPAPREYRPDDVKRVRELLGTSQAVLAGFLGVNVNTVRSWEQGKRPPQPIARRFLFEIESDPAYWRRRIGQETIAPRLEESNG